MDSPLIATANYIKSRIHSIPEVLVICGSGLSNLSDSIREDKVVIAYDDVPNFPQTTIKGHASEIVCGRINGVNVAMLRGRFHSYEGHSMETCVLPVRAFAKLGTKFMVVTNAAGGLNRNFNVGDVMLMSDHIGIPLLGGKGPLVGRNDDTLGARFPPMSNAYDVELRAIAKRAAEQLNFSSFFRESGTYVMVSGPQYETAAESAMLVKWGADAVGMSTVPEVVAAHHAGMRVLGISLITNAVVLPDSPKDAKVASHAEVLETTRTRTKDVQLLVETILGTLSKSGILANGNGGLGHAATLPLETPTKTEKGTTTTTTVAVLHGATGNTVTELGAGHVPSSSHHATPGPTMTSEERDVLRRLRKLNVANLTPLQAIQILNEMCKSLGNTAETVGR